MIIAIDVGGTKTLVAFVSDNGQVQNKIKFPTPQNYSEFIAYLVEQIKNMAAEPISTISIAVPGIIDRESETIILLPNLPWADKPIVADISRAFDGSKVLFENDANLATLSEAHALESTHQRVMYVTFSTGVGTGFVIDGILAPDLLAAEGGHMVFEHDGQMMEWESFASGKAIVTKYGKMASDLEDPAAWRDISKNMAIGIFNCNAIFSADTVVIGGGVGTYFEKYGQMLREEVDLLLSKTPLPSSPKIVGAQHAEEAVMLGCVIFAMQHEQR